LNSPNLRINKVKYNFLMITSIKKLVSMNLDMNQLDILFIKKFSKKLDNFKLNSKLRSITKLFKHKLYKLEIDEF
jgi:hypothetical protein